MKNKTINIIGIIFLLFSFISCKANEDSSTGNYYGAQHTPIEKDYKEPTCQEEGYSIIGCAECDMIFETTILPVVDCCYVDNKCKWCGAKIYNEPFEVIAVPQDIEYKGRHYHMLWPEVKVKKEEVGDLLGYIIREEDVSAFINEYPNLDYVICSSVYDYYNNNRIPFYSVKEYEDLSFICVYVLGYILYQDITDLLE